MRSQNPEITRRRERFCDAPKPVTNITQQNNEDVMHARAPFRDETRSSSYNPNLCFIILQNVIIMQSRAYRAEQIMTT